MAASYLVTRRFISGLLNGLTITQEMSWPPIVGFRCDNPLGGSGYVILAVVPVS